MKFTDTHCHLYKEYYSDMDTVINDAKENKIIKFISDADNIASSYEMLELAKSYDSIYCTVGIHPESCNEDVSEIEKLLEENIDNKKLVAVGEIGLDYYYGKDNMDRQKEIFDYQLSLAEKYNLPVVVHSREATKDTIDILSKHKVKGVIHCFSGSLETANIYLKMGFLIGVGGVITFKNAKISEVIKEIPVNKIVLETDSPFLAPTPYRGKTNEPKYVLNIAEFVANLYGISLEELSNITEKNVTEVFDI